MLAGGAPEGKPASAWTLGAASTLPSCMRRRTIAALAAALVVTAAAAFALVSSQSGTLSPVPPPRRCGAVAKEKLDSRSLQHVLPETPPPEFGSEQPTSGPHSPVQLAGVQPEPLSPVLQVGLLEEGAILLQHQGLNDQARKRLEALAGPEVVVAPGHNLPDSVLATAWTFKMRCDGVEPDALTSFITRHRGGGLG
jgi:hypothetical protein